MTNTVLQKLSNKLNTYLGIQVILANQNIPESKLERPRILLNWLTKGNNNYPHTHSEAQRGYDSVNEKIIINRSTSFNYTMSVRLVGKSINDFEYIQKARDWFLQPYLSDIALDEFDGSVREILNIDDLSSFSQTEYQYEYNFDVIINFGKDFEYEVEDIQEVKINE